MAYIDRDKVLNRLRQLGEITSEPPMDDKDKYNLELIHRLESEFSHYSIADVEEVKHGKWIIKRDDYDYEYMKCSCCKEEFYPYDSDTVDTTPNYCMNCGAKMEGDKAK